MLDQKFNIVKVSILPKLINKFNTGTKSINKILYHLSGKINRWECSGSFWKREGE